MVPPQPRRPTLVRWALVLRAVLVLALGFALLVFDTVHPVLGNILATFWLIGAVLTLRWSRDYWGADGCRMAIVAGLAGVAGAVIGLTRVWIAEAFSVDATLTLLGTAAILIGLLRIMGAVHDVPDGRPALVPRVALGASEVCIGIVWIAVDDASRTLATAGGLWALFFGALMVLATLDRSRRPADRG